LNLRKRGPNGAISEGGNGWGAAEVF